MSGSEAGPALKEIHHQGKLMSYHLMNLKNKNLGYYHHHSHQSVSLTSSTISYEDI
jgi:hypothetical protein